MTPPSSQHPKVGAGTPSASQGASAAGFGDSWAPPQTELSLTQAQPGLRSDLGGGGGHPKEGTSSDVLLNRFTPA